MGQLRRRAYSLPSVIDGRAYYGEVSELPEPLAGDFEWENPYAWRIEYQALYEDYVMDSRIKGRAMAGNTAEAAILRLQKLLVGFGVIRVVIWHIRGPRTEREAREIAELNRRLDAQSYADCHKES